MISDEQPIREISVTRLGRNPSAAIDAAEAGERVIVTREGRPVAVLVGCGHGIDLMLAGAERFVLLRREAREDLERGIASELESWRARWS